MVDLSPVRDVRMIPFTGKASTRAIGGLTGPGKRPCRYTARLRKEDWISRIRSRPPSERCGNCAGQIRDSGCMSSYIPVSYSEYSCSFYVNRMPVTIGLYFHANGAPVTIALYFHVNGAPVILHLYFENRIAIMENILAPGSGG